MAQKILRSLFTFGPYDTPEEMQKHLSNIIADAQDFLQAMNSYFLLYKEHRLLQWQVLPYARYPGFHSFLILAEFELFLAFPQEPAKEEQG